MARAKQTDRAEARRRYRQTNRLSAEAEPNTLEANEPVEAGAGGRSARPAAVGRPSLSASFRAAYHPANVREDIRLLPQLLRTRAFLVAAALVIVGTLFVAVQPTSTLAAFAFQTFVLPPAIAPIFVAGFFAPRASYLIGFVVSLIDVVAYAFLLTLVAPVIGLEGAADVPSLVGTALLVGPTSGILFAAAAAWYKRFLALSSISRQQRGRAAAKSKAGRR